MLINFDVLKKDVQDMPEKSLDENIYQIVDSSFNKINDGTYEKWDIHDIKEEEDKYVVVLKVTTKEESVEVAQEPVEDHTCCSDCVECNKTVEEYGSFPEEPISAENPLTIEKSNAYEGPWSDKIFELDIAQASALFEVVQFCDYMVKVTQMITPVAARSLQECQKFILENFTEFNADDIKAHHASPEKPLEIKINDDFAAHLKKWQEESVEIFEKLVQEVEKKPKIVTANMVPQAGFDPRGPGAR